MARSLRAFLLATALGAALVVPSTGSAAGTTALNGGAAPIASLAATGGAAADGAAAGGSAPDGAAAGGSAPDKSAGRHDAFGAQSGGAVPGRAPKRVGRPARKPVRPGGSDRPDRPARRAPRRAVKPPERRAAPRRVPVAPTDPETPAVPPATSSEPTVSGLFPVHGPSTFGGEGSRFGVGRPGHVHQGQDVAAASGTPLVAPVAGTVTWKANQPEAAGIYLVIRGADGRDYVFMHLLRGSVLVAPGDAVAAGQQIAQVGETGDASGPHLHFEIWVGGWQEDGGAPIDPLPQLQRWAGGS